MPLSHNLNQLRKIITDTAINCGRSPNDILLLAVSKQQNVSAISKAFELGVTDFGENYYQEALSKINQLKHTPICWHFIGPIQSNKTKGIAQHFSWVHSINRIKIATQLNENRPIDSVPLNVCIQINLLEEKSKAGITCEQAADLALAVSELPHLKLRGLMTIPPPQLNEEEQYKLLIQLRELMYSLNQKLGLNMETLSMGMSDDLVPAIKAGSTIIRIGRAIFGERRGSLS